MQTAGCRHLEETQAPGRLIFFKTINKANSDGDHLQSPKRVILHPSLEKVILLNENLSEGREESLQQFLRFSIKKNCGSRKVFR